MSLALAEPWRPLYDPEEPPQAFSARQRRAYAAFDVAWQDERVALRLKGYYDQLVRDVGANAYTWWSEARWAEAFGVSCSTIKRVLAALHQAGLIRRERRFSGASRTYLTAYDRNNPLSEGETTHMVDADNQIFPPTQQDVDFTTHDSSALQPRATDTIGSATPSNGLHDGPPQQRMSAAIIGSRVSSDDQHRRTPIAPVPVAPVDSAAPPDDRHRKTSHLRWTSSETTADPDDRCPACGAGHSPALQGSAERARENTETRIEIEAGPSDVERVDYRQSEPPFVGAKRDPTFGSFMNPHHLKSPNLTAGGGGTPATSDPATRQMLEREGVTQFFLAAALAQQPPAELQAVSRYLNAQRSVHDRPRLFAWLATHGYGAQLLGGPGHGPVERRRRRRAAPPTTAHAPVVPPGAPPTAEQPVWAQVRDRLAQDVAATELATWLDGTVLLDLTETAAVVGTPNVFVRDYVQQNHAPVLEATLGAVLGRSIAVTLVVDGCA